MKYNPVDIARQFLYIREAQSLGDNRGLRVESIQHWSGGQYGDSWCCEFVWFVLDICYEGNAPIPREQSCQSLLDLANSKGWSVTDPQPGDLYFYVNSNGHAHHVGIVTQSDPLLGIAGNTSADGTSSNGDRVAEHGISATIFVRIPT